MPEQNLTEPQSAAAAERVTKRRTALYVAGVLAAAAVIGVLLTGIASSNQTERRGRPVVTVGAAVAALADLPLEIDALGSVTPEASAAVVPRASGTITSINFTEGQMVRQGQVLAEIDPRQYQAALQQAQGQLERDAASLQNSKLDLERYQTLLKQDSISKQQVDTQAALVRQNDGVLDSDRANVANAQLNLSYCKITAPLNGRAGLRQIDKGNYVAAGSATPLVTITQIDPIDVMFTLPEDQLQRVILRQQQAKGLPVTAYDRADKTKLADGALITLDNVVDSSTGTVKARARLTNSSGVLLANQFINVHMLVDTLKGAVTVPASAIRHGPDGDFVWILAADKTAEMRTVKTGPIVGETAAITTGVKLGETVITEGGDNLRDGAPVALPGAQPKQGAAAGKGRRSGQSGSAGRRRRNGGGGSSTAPPSNGGGQ